MQTIPQLKKQILPILKRHGVAYAAVFGSFARSEARPDSDLDILVRFNHDISLLEHIGVAQDLEDLLHMKIDLIPEQSLKDHVVSHVKKDLTTLYGKSQRPDIQ